MKLVFSCSPRDINHQFSWADTQIMFIHTTRWHSNHVSVLLNLQQIKDCSLFLIPSDVTLRWRWRSLPIRVWIQQTLCSDRPLSILCGQYISATLTKSLQAAWKWGDSGGLQPHRTVTEQTAWPTDLQTAEEGADCDLHTATLIWQSSLDYLFI